MRRDVQTLASRSSGLVGTWLPAILLPSEGQSAFGDTLRTPSEAGES